jgi:hypothetical protein
MRSGFIVRQQYNGEKLSCRNPLVTYRLVLRFALYKISNQHSSDFSVFHMEIFNRM